MRRALLYLLGSFAALAKIIGIVVGALRGFLMEVVGLLRTVRDFRHRRRWYLRVGKPIRAERVILPRSEVERLLKRSRDLKDMQDLTRFGGGIILPEQDFTVTRAQVEELLRRILEAGPPFLYLGRALPDPQAAEGAPPQSARIRKREITRVRGPVELLVPEDHPRTHAADQPPGDQALRPARSIAEMRRGRLLDQILPPRLQIERLSHGDLMVVEYVRTEPHVEFVPRIRQVDYLDEREVEIEVELEAVDPDTPTQLLYFLIDTSASMRGASALLAAAAVCAVHRANMALPVHYSMRSFAEYVDPPWDQAPWTASTLAEREAMYERIFSLNFNGQATHTGAALEAACRDIAAARQAHEEVQQASILLITDGRSDLRQDTIATVLRSGAPLHTVMVSRERNRDLERISTSFTTLAGLPGLEEAGGGPSDEAGSVGIRS